MEGSIDVEITRKREQVRKKEEEIKRLNAEIQTLEQIHRAGHGTTPKSPRDSRSKTDAIVALGSPPGSERIPLVFIHGWKGSHLKCYVTGRRMYLNRSTVLGLSNPDIRLPLMWDGDVQRRDTLIPTEPIDRMFGKRIYGPFIGRCKTLHRPFYIFVYDWRRDNIENSRYFEHFLQAIAFGNKVPSTQQLWDMEKELNFYPAKSHNEKDSAPSTRGVERPIQKVQVVAHSNGGLITLAVLNRRPQLFHSVLFAGVPFRGGVGLFEDFHDKPAATGLNTVVMDKKVLFSFPTLYNFFALDPRENLFFASDGKTKLDIDMHEIDEWERHRIGPFAPKDLKGGKPAQKMKKLSKIERAHLRKALHQAKEFRKMISYNSDIAYPPLAVLCGINRPSFGSVIRNGPRSVRGWDVQTGFRADGDGRVPVLKALPPKGIPFTFYSTKREHTDLLNTRKVFAMLFDLLIQANNPEGSSRL